MKVLFLGATGIVGRQVVAVLGRELELTLAAFGGGEVDGSPVADCDITDFEATLALFQKERFDAVVNCAIADRHTVNEDSVEEAHQYALRCLDVNARGAYHVYEAASRTGVSRCVFISSLTTVLGKPLYEHVEVDALPRPRNIYAATKLFGEELGYTYAHRARSPLQVHCLRLGQPFRAMRMSDENWNDSAFGRSMMVHYEDIALAIECALKSEVRYGVYPILSGSDGDWINQSRCAEIGYSPCWTFTSNGTIERSRSIA